MGATEKQLSLSLSLSLTYARTHARFNGEVWREVLRQPSVLAGALYRLHITRSINFRKTSTIFLAFQMENGSHFVHFIGMAAQY